MLLGATTGKLVADVWQQIPGHHINIRAAIELVGACPPGNGSGQIEIRARTISGD